MRAARTADIVVVGSNQAADQKEEEMGLTETCLLLGTMIAFATLVVKVIEVSRKQ